MILKADLHTHTNRYSPCSTLSPDALCQVALQRGLNALAITEHNYQWSASEIAELQAHYPALKVYAGVEITCEDGHDYIILGWDAGRYSPRPMPYPQLKSLLNTRPEAFSFIAHCFRYSGDENGLRERPVDGLELGNYNLLARPQPPTGPILIERIELYHKWQQAMNWTALYNSDGHSEKMVGTFYNLIETDNIPPDEASLIHLLRHAEIRPFQDDVLIRRSINGAQRPAPGSGS